jgi:hypothetical protein
MPPGPSDPSAALSSARPIEELRYVGPSMFPTLRTGDRLVLVGCSPAEIRPGDVIAYHRAGSQALVVHRVIAADAPGFRTRGDANWRADGELVPPERIAGRVVSARRGRARICVRGGWSGRIEGRLATSLTVLVHSLRLALARAITSAPGFPALRRRLTRWCRPRVVAFRRSAGVEFQLFLGRRSVARFVSAEGRWRVRPPFGLLIDAGSLPSVPTAPPSAGVARESRDRGIDRACGNIGTSPPLVEWTRLILAGRCVDGPVPRHVDWERELARGKRHQLFPFLGWAVATGRLVSCPPDIRDGLAREYHRADLRNRLIASRLEPILRDSGERGIELMVLKGLVLGLDAYESPGCRWFQDVDLLVREEQFPWLRAVLGRHGYEAEIPELSEKDLPRYASFVRQIRFASHTGPSIEAHFRLFNTGIPPTREPSWSDARLFRLGGASLCRPSDERFLLHLCFHAQQHAFSTLRLLLDLAVWWSAHPIDAGRLAALARENRLGATAYHALTYASDLLGLPDSGPLRNLLRPPRWKRAFFARAWRDAEIRALGIRRGSSDAELPRAFLLGEAPLLEKIGFLRHVLWPPARWLTDEGSPGAARRIRHLSRVIRGAWSERSPLSETDRQGAGEMAPPATFPRALARRAPQ